MPRSFSSLPLARTAMVIALVTLATFDGAYTAAARPRHQFDPSPFATTPCSVLSGEPCGPNVCGVFGPNPCIPDLPYPYSSDLRLTIESHPKPQDVAKYQKPDHDLDTLSDLNAALRACWTPPDAGASRDNMEMSVRFSFRRDGSIISQPRVTFASRDASGETRDAYLRSITDSLTSCLPLTFTRGLGGAVAGKPIAIRYVDNRSHSRDAGQP